MKGPTQQADYLQVEYEVHMKRRVVVAALVVVLGAKTVR